MSSSEKLESTPATVIPNNTTLQHAAKLAIQMDCPIQLDYYVESTNNKAFVGEDAESKDKVLVKSKDEYTSLIQKFYKVGEDFLVLTENSIYVVNSKIQKKKVNLPSSGSTSIENEL